MSDGIAYMHGRCVHVYAGPILMSGGLLHTSTQQRAHKLYIPTIEARLLTGIGPSVYYPHCTIWCASPLPITRVLSRRIGPRVRTQRIFRNAHQGRGGCASLSKARMDVFVGRKRVSVNSLCSGDRLITWAHLLHVNHLV
jgi:hypothetical protein